MKSFISLGIVKLIGSVSKSEHGCVVFVEMDRFDLGCYKWISVVQGEVAQ